VTYKLITLLCRSRRHETNATGTNWNGIKTKTNQWHSCKYDHLPPWSIYRTYVASMVTVSCCCTAHRRKGPGTAGPGWPAAAQDCTAQGPTWLDRGRLQTVAAGHYRHGLLPARWSTRPEGLGVQGRGAARLTESTGGARVRARGGGASP